MAARHHNVFVGSETGLLKGVNTTQWYFQNLNGIAGLNREQEIKESKKRRIQATPQHAVLSTNAIEDFTRRKECPVAPCPACESSVRNALWNPKMAARHHNVFVGSETGLLKGVNTTQRYFQNLNGIAGLGREQEIKVMCWGNDEETEICCGLKNRSVKIYDVKTGSFTQALEVTGGEGPLKGIAKYNNHFITCTQSGLVKVWNDNEGESKIEFEVGKQICRMRQNAERPSVVATGGKENEVKIWDLENTKWPIFKAKNVANDFLDHRVPVWVTDVQFVPNSEKFVVCTGYHHIRLYDPKSGQKRPVINMEFDEYPLTALSLAHRENYVIVGNSRGRMGLFDLRKRLLVHCFKGFAGSIRSVHCHPLQPLVASCGLDRFLRVHDIGTHQLLHKVYLKSRLNCTLFTTRANFDVAAGPDTTDAVKEGQEQEAEENVTADDDLWEEMDDASDGENGKRKSSRSDVNRRNAKKVKKIKFKVTIEDSLGHLSNDSKSASAKKGFVRKRKKNGKNAER